MTPTVSAPARETYPELAGTRRFTADEYRRLTDAGIVGPDEPVELQDGYVVYADEADAPQVDPLFPDWWRLRPWTSDEYQRMTDAGVMAEDEKVELLAGYLVLKMPENLNHRSATTRVANRLRTYLPAGWLAVTQHPLSLGLSDPIPDGVVLRGGVEDYDRRYPTGADVGIVIEVGGSTLLLDRRGKGGLYSRCRLPVYWIINVEDRQVEVYADPDPAANPPAYRDRKDYQTGDTVPIVLDGVAVGTIPVAELLP